MEKDIKIVIGFISILIVMIFIFNAGMTGEALFSFSRFPSGCKTNADCGTSGWVGAPYCIGNNVYQSYKSAICVKGTFRNSCKITTSNMIKEKCLPGKCSNGKCSGTACTDSDGGKNLYEAGNTKYTAKDGTTGGTIDNCVFLNNPNGVLKEAVCDEGIASFVSITCPEGTPYCRYGKCTSDYVPACSENDGGNKPGIKGAIKETRYSDGPKHEDYCEDLNTLQPTYDENEINTCKGDSCGLREYYCTDPYVTTAYVDVPCPNGCSNGACIHDTTNKCVDAGYKCTSAIRGCGHYKEFDLDCSIDPIGITCCEEIPYCGDGVCFKHPSPNYGENAISCPKDCA